MYLLSFMLLLASRIALPEGFTPHLQLVLRWIHFIGGITWVGLLYFFVLVNANFLKQLDAGTRAKVVPLLMPRALWWFRWASVVTVLAGIWYWMMIVGADARNAQTSGGGAIGTFFGIWTVAFAIEMALLMAPAEILKKSPVFGVVMGLVVITAGWLYLDLNAHGWASNRLLAIGIGGGRGWVLLFEGLGVVWGSQKENIRRALVSAANGTPLPAGTPQ